MEFTIQDWFRVHLSIEMAQFPRILQTDTECSLAAINMKNFTIFYNPNGLEKAIKDYKKETGETIDIQDFFHGTLLHEVSHCKYSPTSSAEKEAAKVLPSNIPFSFTHHVNNVIQDGVIQWLSVKDHDCELYQRSFKALQKVIQGKNSFENMKNAYDYRGFLNWTSMLFYLILKVYNETDQDVQDFGVKIGFRPETLGAVNTAISMGADKDSCLKYTVETVVPMLYEDIKAAYEAQPLEPDKDEDEEENEDGDGQGQDQSGPAAEPDPFSKDKNPDTEDSSDSSEDEDDQEDQSGDHNQDGKSADPSQCGSDTDNKDSSEGDASENGKSDEDFNKRLEEACKELSSQGLDDENRQEAPESSWNHFTEEEIAEILSGIFDAPTEINNDNEVIDTREHSIYSKMSAYAVAYYNSLSRTLARINNIHDEHEVRLSEGESIEEEIINEFYTDLNMDIWQKDTKKVRDKNIVVTIMIDHSGSMRGDRWNRSRDLCVALCHAFEEVDVKTEIYSFGTYSHIIKKFDDKAILVNSFHSSVNLNLNNLTNWGGTNPMPVLKYITSSPRYNDLDDETIKILYFITDGGVDNPRLSQPLFQRLKEKGWNIFGVALDCVEDFAQDAIGASGIAKSYNTETLITELGDEIYQLIVDNILIR